MTPQSLKTENTPKWSNAYPSETTLRIVFLQFTGIFKNITLTNGLWESHVPATVRGLKCTPNEDNNTTALDVRWEAAKGDSTFYKIMYMAKDDTTDTKCMNIRSENTTFYNLTPGRIYNISVFTISVDLKNQDPANTTGQTEPADVSSVKVAGYGKQAVIVKWDAAIGDVDVYFVDLYAGDKMIRSTTAAYTASSHEVIFYDLKYDFLYDAMVKTCSYALNSTGKCGSGHSPIHVDLIVGLTVFFLLAAIIIATGGFLIKKCRIKKQDEITRDFSLRCQNLPISLSQFDDHYHNLEANSELGFSEEFAKLQDVGRCEIISVARLPENRERNRYTNILPYDVTRVILSSEVGKSDYINASFIPGKSSPREYIASQGPMMGTLVDFWHMVWELGVSNIIMLTKCVENGKKGTPAMPGTLLILCGGGARKGSHPCGFIVKVMEVGGQSCIASSPS
uniref:receptor-type tyrosine-protein phosphatase H-like n=1 Tax=Myxine glutinosa TaxID=7769 RepID=UPI00358FF406